MRILVVEDEFVSRKILSKMRSSYGEIDIAVDGLEAIEAFTLAREEGESYGLICLDFMRPELDGQNI